MPGDPSPSTELRERGDAAPAGHRSPPSEDTRRARVRRAERQRHHRINDRRMHWRNYAPWMLLLPAAIMVNLLASQSPSAVESIYSRGLYPAIVAGLSHLTGFLPFAVGEILVGLFLLWIVWRVARAAAALLGHERSLLNLLKHGLAKTVAFASILYAAFLLAWGLNYQREPLAKTLALELRPTSVSELEALCRHLVTQTNATRANMVDDGDGIARLNGTLGDMLTRAREGYTRASAASQVLDHDLGPPKPVLLSPIMSMLGISGIYFPFTGEPNVNATCPDPILPFVVCHEMGHQLGFGPEDEANFLGYLACVSHPDDDFRYSGNFAAMQYSLGALGRVDAARAKSIASTLSKGVLRDWSALEEWRDQYHSPIADASRAVNGAYLMAQGQHDGVASYGRMVDLLLAHMAAGRMR